MPVAIPLAVAAASAVGGDIASNDAAKAANASADNKANAARSDDKQALQSALNNLAAYNKANPSPGSQYTIGSAPASVGGGVFSGGSGVAQNVPGVGTAGMNMNTLMSALEQGSQSGGGGGVQPAAASQLPPNVIQLMQQLKAKSAQPIARTANPNAI